MFGDGGCDDWYATPSRGRRKSCPPPRPRFGWLRGGAVRPVRGPPSSCLAPLQGPNRDALGWPLLTFTTNLKTLLDILRPRLPSCCLCARLSDWTTELPGHQVPWSRHGTHHITVRVQPNTGQRSLAVLTNVCPCLVCCQHLLRLSGDSACLPACPGTRGRCVHTWGRAAKDSQEAEVDQGTVVPSSFLLRLPPSLLSECRQGFRLELCPPVLCRPSSSCHSCGRYHLGLLGQRAKPGEQEGGIPHTPTNLPVFPTYYVIRIAS